MNATTRLAALVTQAARPMLSEEPGEPKGNLSLQVKERALRKVLATDEGQELWEAVRLEELALSKREESTVFRAASHAGATQRLNALIMSTARERGISPEAAQSLVLATADGRELWEGKRAEELADSRQAGR